MKTCKYCGKSLEESQTFCNDYCRAQTKKYEAFTERFKKVFAVSVSVCFLSVLFGSAAIFLKLAYADYISAAASFAMGLALVLLPFAPPALISKQGIEKSCFGVRAVGLVFILWSVWQIFA